MSRFNLIWLLAFMSFAADSDNTGKEPGGPIDNGGGNLIGGIDYKGHNVGLINKHGWEFRSQRLFNGYLKNYYTETAGVIESEMGAAAAWIPGGSTAVRPYGSGQLEVIAPADHIIDSFGHIRPAIVRYWSGP